MIELTGVVTTIESAGQYTDKTRRVTISLKHAENQLRGAIVIRSNDLQLDDEVRIVIEPASRPLGASSLEPEASNV